MRFPTILRRRPWLAGLLAAGVWLAAVSPAPAFYWAAWPSNKKITGGGGGGGGGSGGGGGGSSTPTGGGNTPPSDETPGGGSSEGGGDSPPSPEAPEPSALALGLLGLGTAWLVRRQKK